MVWKNLEIAKLVPETVASIGLKTRWELAIQVRIFNERTTNQVKTLLF